MRAFFDYIEIFACRCCSDRAQYINLLEIFHLISLSTAASLFGFLMRFQSSTFSSLLFLIRLCRLVEVDDFISNLWNVHQAVKQQGYVQVPPTIRYVFRSVWYEY